MNRFGFAVLAISLLQSEGFRVRHKAQNLKESSTDEGVMHKRARGKAVTSRPTLATNIFGADAEYWEKGWKKGWEGCPAGWVAITNQDDCLEAAYNNEEEYGLEMEDDDWDEENGFTAAEALAWWPQGCVVNKHSNKVKFNNQKRADGELLKLKHATNFKVICAKGVKHAYFDFDQTLTRIHVFHSLVALGARVESGQVHKLMDVDKTTWQYDKTSSQVVADAAGTPWSIAALGGTDRIEDYMRPYLSVLKEAGVKLTVITKGNVGAARYILEKANLMHLFETVYGNIGDNYGPATEYDLAHTAATGYEGKPGDNLQNWNGKVGLITELMKQNDASFSEAVLVEDDKHEISSVQDTCEAVFVKKRQGTQSSHLKQIIALAGI